MPITVTLSLGWWLIPAIITVFWIIATLYVASKDKSSGDYSFAGLMTFFVATMGTIATLIAWLIYYMVKFYSR